MKRLSKYVERSELDARTRERTIYMVALHLVMTSKPDARETVRLDGDRYVLSLYGRYRSDGGVLIVRYVHTGQHDSVTAYYFEDFRRDTQHNQPFASACERLAYPRPTAGGRI